MTLVMLAILQTTALCTGWRYRVEMAYNAFSADTLVKVIGFNNDKKHGKPQKCYAFWKNHNKIVKSTWNALSNCLHIIDCHFNDIKFNAGAWHIQSVLKYWFFYTGSTAFKLEILSH